MIHEQSARETMHRVMEEQASHPGCRLYNESKGDEEGRCRGSVRQWTLHSWSSHLDTQQLVRILLAASVSHLSLLFSIHNRSKTVLSRLDSLIVLVPKGVERKWQPR